MGTRAKKRGHVVRTQSGEMVAYEQNEFRADILPPPDELERYEAMNPGTTKIILESYINQVNHRMKLEESVIESDNKRANKAQIISAFIIGSCIVAGSVLAFFDKNLAGLSLIFGSVGALLTAFYGGSILRKMERSKKDLL